MADTRDGTGANGSGLAKARPRGSGAGMAMSRQKLAKVSPLSRYLGYRLRRAQLTVYEDFFRTFADLELRPAHFGLLVVVGESPGLKQAEASAALGIQTPNFVALVDELESRGLAQRLRAENDRRSHALHLTKAGEALLKRVVARQEEHEARMTAKLGPAGREQLMSLLEKLAGD
jgi:DNA-binding MarR family transcriptional regulator